MENLRPEQPAKSSSLIPLVHDVHHWIIEEATGPTSMGECIKCNTTRVFKNWIADSDNVTNEEHRVLRESSGL